MTKTYGIPRFKSNGARVAPGIRVVDFRPDGSTRIMTDDDERTTDEWTEIFFDTDHTCEEIDDPTVPTPMPHIPETEETDVDEDEDEDEDPPVSPENSVPTRADGLSIVLNFDVPEGSSQ